MLRVVGLICFSALLVSCERCSGSSPEAGNALLPAVEASDQNDDGTPSPSNAATSSGPTEAPNDDQSSEPSTPPPQDAPFVGRIDIVDVQRDVIPAVLAEVRAGRHAGFDRFVWQFEGSEAPGYHIEYVDKPVRKCGSGEPTPIAGEGWLEVRLSPAHAHTEAGKPTVEERERQLQLGVARELELTCDFEAVVTWVIGLSSPNAYRVLEMSDPTRIVVDVQH